MARARVPSRPSIHSPAQVGGVRRLSVWGVVALAFFVTGFNGLVFELLWIRLLSAIFGTTIQGTSTTLAAFLGGLGIGAFTIGRWIDRRELTLRGLLGAFAACEVIAGGLSLALCLAFPRLAALGAMGADVSPAILLMRATATFALLFLPSFLMGGSLPILSKALLAISPRPGRTVGLLYALNTLGAAAGAILVDAWLVMHLGIMRTALVAAAGNAVAAAFVVITLIGASPAPPTPKRVRQEPIPEPVPDERAGMGSTRTSLPARAWLIALYGVSGFCALGYEVAWTRILLNEVFSSRFAVSTMLAVVLIGLVVGGALMSALLPPRRYLIPVLAVIQALIGLSALGGLIALESWGPALRRIAEGWTARAIAIDTAGINLVGVADCLPLVAVLQGIPSLLLGAVLPLVAEGSVAASRQAGGDVGRLYLGNTIGAIAGAIGVGFLLLPMVSAGRTLQILAGLNVVLAILLITARTTRGRQLVGVLIGAGAMALVALAPASGYMQRREDRTRKAFKPALESRTLVLEEGVYETVAVREYRLQGIPVDWRLITNSYSMSGVNMIGNRYMRLMAHIPLLLQADPSPADWNVALIAFGVGNTARALALHPVDHLDVIEISPGVLDVAPYLRMANAGVLEDPRVSVHVNDGRNYLLGTDRRYDLITFEPPPPGQADIVGLYTREYYRLVRDRLTAGGCMTQWLPIIQVTHRANLSMIRSALDVFPHVSLWTGIFDELILCASLAPMPLDAGAITQRIQGRGLESDLREIGIEDAEGLLATFLADEKVLSQWTLDVPPVTDDNRLLEYEYARKARESSHIRDYHRFYQSSQYVPGIDRAEQDAVRRISVWRLDQMMGVLRDPDFPGALFPMVERENLLYLADVMLGLPRAAASVVDDPAALHALAQEPTLLEQAFWHCLLRQRYRDAAQVLQARLDRWPAEDRYVQLRDFAMSMARRPPRRARALIRPAGVRCRAANRISFRRGERGTSRRVAPGPGRRGRARSRAARCRSSREGGTGSR